MICGAQFGNAAMKKQQSKMILAMVPEFVDKFNNSSEVFQFCIAKSDVLLNGYTASRSGASTVTVMLNISAVFSLAQYVSLT